MMDIKETRYQLPTTTNQPDDANLLPSYGNCTVAEKGDYSMLYSSVCLYVRSSYCGYNDDGAFSIFSDKRGRKKAGKIHFLGR